MRPAGEVRQALLQACEDLATPERGPTLREMAHKAKVGVDAATRTVRHMRRSKQIHILQERRVSYRNRPVAEYVPAQLAPSKGCMSLANVLRVWAG